MQVHPKEIIKQMIKMQKEGYGDEEPDSNEEEAMLQ